MLFGKVRLSGESLTLASAAILSRWHALTKTMLAACRCSEKHSFSLSVNVFAIMHLLEIYLLLLGCK